MRMLFNNIRRYLWVTIYLLALLCGQQALAQDINNPYVILKRVTESLSSITDYTCIFSKHELIGNRIIKEDNIALKVKRPGHFYMKWQEGPKKGRIAIYVEGQNNNRVLINMGGVMGLLPVAIDPNGKNALKENRHPITEADFITIFERVTKNYIRCRTDPECSPLEIDSKDPDTLVLKMKFPPGKGYYTHSGCLTIDRKRWLPIGIVCYGWNNEFLEEYSFTDIKINPGLTEQAFKKDW
jgi:outer membrane lipoprotein-sorting protein